MKNKSLTPQIRFKGYDDEWQYKPLVSIANIYGGLTYSPTNVREHGTFVLRSSNVKNGQVINADNVYVETEIVNVQNALEVGDIIMVVRNGSKALIGKHTPVIKTMPNTVIGAFMSGIRTSQPFFFNALFDTNSFSAEVDKNSGATINQITGGMFKQMGFMVPSDEEQAWIGNFFEKLQQSYTDIEREITRLEKMKQASLQKMFPRPGETTPEIRFDGFTEPWKKVTFSDVFTPLKNNTLSRDCLNYTSGMAKNIHYGDVLIKFGAVININDEIVPYVNETVSFSQSPFHLLKDGDIIFADTAEDEAVGKCVEIIGATEFNSVSGLHTIAVRPNFSFAPSFLGYYLNSSTYHSQLLPLMQGVKVLSIGRNALATTEICYPSSHEEQCVIGEYLGQYQISVDML